MHTKVRFHLMVRVLSFVLILCAIGIRLAEALPRQEVPQVTEVVEIVDYPTLLYTPPVKQAVTFSASDAAFAPILNWSGETVDAEALIQAPLDITVTNEPLILILHTHATEAYCNISGFRTEDKTQNVVRVGQALADTLNQNGIRTIHDTTLIDLDGYYDSYARAGEIIESYLEQYPSIQMVIDVHRDSATDSNGKQVVLSTPYQDGSAAQLMFVMGTDNGGLYHPNWQGNVSFALKLQALCEQEVSGIFRNLNLRSQRYNQHYTPYSVLVEFGSAGNTLDEALNSAEIFADALITLLNQNR